MDWLLENFFWVLVIGGMIASWIANTRKAKEEREKKMREQGPDSGRIDQEDRSSDIREEILRKIAERRGDIFGEETLEGDEPAFLFEEPAPVAPPPIPVSPMQESPIQGETLLEQLRALESELSETNSGAKSAKSAYFVEEIGAETSQQKGIRGFKSILKDNDEIRRAIVLREVLGPPIGLIK